MTSGASVEELKSSGTLRALKTAYHEGLMEFCGIELVGHLYLGRIDPHDETDRRRTASGTCAPLRAPCILAGVLPWRAAHEKRRFTER